MNAETHWYTSYRAVRRHGGGVDQVPPMANRLSRRPLAEQWLAALDLAIEIATGKAQWRHASISLTGERYWIFRGEWWLISCRVERRARILVEAAINTERSRAAAAGIGYVDGINVVRLLRRWSRGRRWYRLASRVPSLRLNQPGSISCV